ncbi:MAG: 2OG-Fe(II) oxygenase, partial [Sediminibacterium sp.]|nr:2OG-Fe(II) oxygenase [Sediminibacterium sp.]
MPLFDEGKKGFRDFQLPGADLKLWEQFFSKDESDRYCKHFLETTPWERRSRKMYDKVVQDPRFTAFYGGRAGYEWTPELLRIKERVEATCGIAFNGVLLNYDRDGNDSVAWHSDHMPPDGKHHAIASVT